MKPRNWILLALLALFVVQAAATGPTNTEPIHFLKHTATGPGDEDSVALNFSVSREDSVKWGAELLDARNWSLITTHGAIPIDTVQTNQCTSPSVTYDIFIKEHLDWIDDESELILDMGENSTGYPLSMPEGSVPYKFESKLATRRIVQTSTGFDVDYEIDANLGFTPYTENGRLWGSLSFDCNSVGVFRLPDLDGSTTHHQIGASGNLGYIIDVPRYGLKRYRAIFGFDYILETIQDSTTASPSISDKCPGARCELDIPYTDYLAMWVREVTGYNRGGLPIILEGEYFMEGEDEDGNDVSSRVDFDAWTEVSFHPLFIVKYSLCFSRVYDPPTLSPNRDHWGYTLQVAQNLNTVISKLQSVAALMPWAPGVDRLSEEKEAGNNYIFYRYTCGRKAPDFVYRSESSVGFCATF